MHLRRSVGHGGALGSLEKLWLLLCSPYLTGFLWMLSPLSSGISGSLGTSEISGSLWSDACSSKLLFTSPLQTEEEKNMINLCTAVAQFSGVLYPCKHQVWPRDTQVNILVKWYPYDPSLPLRIHWLLSSSKKHHIQMQGSTSRLCFIHELLHIDGESSINVHIYLWASGRYTIYCGPTQITCRLGAPGTTLTFNKAQNMCTE